ncbi:MAG: hypothetical protein QXW94_07175 [Desulfurococcaceae archaeon]
MSDHYLKLVREELRTSSPGSLPAQRISTILQTLRRSLVKSYFLDGLGKEVLYLLLKRVEGDSELLAKVRAMKIVLQETADENSIDSDIARFTLAVLKVEEMLLSPIVIRYGNKLVYKFNSNCNIEGKLYRRGEVSLLEPRKLVIAEVNMCGEVLKDPLISHWEREILSGRA